jgi:hypothetical protein
MAADVDQVSMYVKVNGEEGTEVRYYGEVFGTR